MFERFKARAFNWAVKQQVSLRTDPGIIKVSQDRLPKWTSWTTEAAVNEGYKASLWVYAAIGKKAKAAASVPWYVYQKDSKGEWHPVKNHPLQILIDKPNPYMSRNNMIERMIMQLDLAGNTLFKKSILGGVPVELWPIGPDGIKPVPDQAEFIKNYEYTYKTGGKMLIPSEEILHAMYIDPSNPYWGIAPLMVAAKTVDTDVEAVNWNKISLQNRAVTDGVFSVPQPLNETQYNELRREIRQQHQGKDNARTPWLLGGGAQWQQMSLSPAEMDFIESRRMTREEIAAVFQVPPPILGILDKANYSNMKEARRVFWLDTILPLLDDLKETFNMSLAPAFGDNIMLDYDTSEVEALAENVNEKIEAANKLFSMGLPFNEINQRLDLGFKEIEGGDIGYLPASLMPANMAATLAASAAGSREAQQPAQENEDETAGKSKPGPGGLKSYNLRSAEQKAMYWKAYERRRAPWYAKLNKEALDLFAKEGKAVANAYKESGDLDAALEAVDLEAWQEFYSKNYLAIIQAFGRDVYEGFKHHLPGEAKAWNPFQQNILSFIFNTSAKKVKQVTDYTKELVRGIVYTGRDRGDSISTIARDLEKGFDEFGTNRAFRIARTEVVAASNHGSQLAAEEAAEEVGDLIKEWIDSGDDRVRDSHEDVNGEKVGLYKKFKNGLLYPGDPNGAAKEVIQCRCTVIYHPKAYT